MAGRNAAAAQAVLLLILEIWESLINGKYMKEACRYDAPKCPTCNSPRDCNNHFCIQCKTGGLCPVVFRGDHAHRNHPWLQVRHYTRQYSVLSEDLEHFISKEGLKHIYTNKLNDKGRHCNLRSKRVAELVSSSSRRTRRARVTGDKNCQGCMATIRGSKDSTETFLVCSLQCLIKVARQHPELDLLAMEEGAMEPMKPPLFYTEKLLKPPRMLETPTNIPEDEASIRKALALPFPLVTDDYPMFGTPAEASFGEALPFPPTIEDFPKLEKTADVAEAPKLETFALPLEIQDLDFSPEWVEMWI